MKTFSLVLTFLLLTAALLLPELAQAQEFPEPVGHVNDFARVFTDDTKTPLEDALRQFEQETTVEIAVVTVLNLQDTTVEDYAVKLFEKWGIGKEGEDNGVLLLFAQEERRVRIEVGYGMEPYLTDGQTGRILDTDVLPDLRAENYALGLDKGAKAIAAHIKASDYEPGTVRPQPAENPVARALGRYFWTILLLGLASIYVVSFMARSTSVWLGGVWGLGAGGLLGWLLLGLGGLIGGAVLLGLTGLLLDHLLSSGYRFQSASQHHTGWGHTWGGFYGAGYQGRHGGDHRGGGHGGFGGGNSGGGGASRGF